MKKNTFILHFVLAMLLMLASGVANAQNAEVYSDGNVRIIQKPDGWQVMHFGNIVAHGEGVLAVKNLPPAFQDFLDVYAKMPESESPKPSLSKSTSYTYGPFLKTQWNQYDPYNALCPTMLVKQDDGSYKEQRTITGCVQIASAQILNYYKYCKPITQSSFITNTQEFKSVAEEFGLHQTRHDVFDTQDYYEYSYEIKDYTPDFDKINNNDHELAKFIYALGLVQKAYYGVEATSSSTSKQLDALNDIYGYKAEYVVLQSLTDQSRIENTIKKGYPAIISGEKADGSGHTFIIDGYNTSGEFHFNYGWGGYSDGWFKTTTYPYNLILVTATPATEDFITMQQTPTALHIKGQGVDKDYTLNYQNGLQYTCEIDLAGGEYEFYFKYSNGVKIAPSTNGSTIVLTPKNSQYAKRGMFSSKSAKFKIADAQTVNFSHNPCLNEISLKVTDFEVLVSGKVNDESGKAIAGAIVSPAGAKPASTDESESDTEDYIGVYQSYNYNDAYFYSQAFQPQKKYIDAIEFCVGIKNSPKELTVAIVDKNKEVLWQKKLASSAINNGDWTKVKLDYPLETTPGDNYYLALYNTGSNTTHTYSYYVDKTTHAIYRVWTSNAQMVHTDSQGNYSIIVEKGFSGKLYAYSDKYVFDPIDLNNVTQELKGQNFTAKEKSVTEIEIWMLPVYTEYTSGEKLEIFGGSIKAHYNNNTTEIIPFEQTTVTGFDTKKIGKQTLTVDYMGCTTTYEVTVEPDPTTATSESIAAHDAKIWAYGKTIVVENGGREISIVDMSGRAVETVKNTGERTEIPMQKSGVYIVKTGLKTQKVVIK